MKTLKHQIRVDGKILDALYATREMALSRVQIAQNCGHVAEYAGTVLVDVMAHMGR